MAAAPSGLSGKDGELMLSRKMRMVLPDSDGKPSEVDIGLVGEVVADQSGRAQRARRRQLHPGDRAGRASITKARPTTSTPTWRRARSPRALKAEKLILMTDVAGIRDEHGKLVSTLDVAHAQQMIEHGTISEGMIPKVECCIDALREGVAKTHIIDGRVLHSLLLETFTRSGIGTEVLRGTRVRKHAGA